MFRAEWRNVFNDAYCTDWCIVKEINLSHTSLQVYNDLCEWLGTILDVAGFVDQREWGHIRTNSAYAEYTLFQLPDKRDRSAEIFTESQYRIIEVENQPTAQTEERMLMLDT